MEGKTGSAPLPGAVGGALGPWCKLKSQFILSGLKQTLPWRLSSLPEGGNTVLLSRREKVPVRAEMQQCWAQAGGPKRSCNCAPKWKLILLLVHRVTAWVRCVHTSPAGTSLGGSPQHGHIPHGSRHVGTSQAGSQDISPISPWEAEAQDPWSCHSQVSSVEDGCVEVHPRWGGGASRHTWQHTFRHSQYISTCQELQSQRSTRSHVMPDKK